MLFREFYDSFIHVEEVSFTAQEELLFEDVYHSVIGKLRNFADKFIKLYTPAKKFRVTLRYPKTSTGAKLGHYVPDTMYVFATNEKEARDKAEELMRNKLEPVENLEKRFPKHNYLKDVKKKHLNLRTKEVRSWEDFVKMLGEIKPSDYLTDYFDEKDLQMILRRKDLAADLKKMDSRQQRMLKKIYLTLSQDPYLSDETKGLLNGLPKAKAKKAEIKDKPQKEWPYWSIFEPKTDEKERELINRISDVKDVFQAGMKFGIPPRDIRSVASPEMDADKQYHYEIKRVYDRVMELITNQIKLKQRRSLDGIIINGKKIKNPVKSFKKLIEDGDYNSKIVSDLGIQWDQIVQSFMYSSEYPAFPFHYQHADETETDTKASEFLWELMYNPPKARAKVDYYRDALEKLLHQKNKSKTIPF